MPFIREQAGHCWWNSDQWLNCYPLGKQVVIDLPIGVVDRETKNDLPSTDPMTITLGTYESPEEALEVHTKLMKHVLEESRIIILVTEQGYEIKPPTPFRMPKCKSEIKQQKAEKAKVQTEIATE